MLTLARRAWAAPIAAHLAALCLVLVGGAAYVGTHASFSEDEGAAIVQARQLAEHHTWIRPHPHPDLDPEGRNYPYELSERGTKGFAPYAKHPLFALILAGLWKVGRVNAMVGFSIVGTVAASFVGSRFGRRFDPSRERPALWAVGLATPLLFDGLLVSAHTVGAALAGALVLTVTSRGETKRVAAVVAAAALAGVLVLLRSEGVLYVGAAAAIALFNPRTRWPGVAAGVAGIGAYLVDHLWTRRIVGSPVVVPLSPAEAAKDQASQLGAGGLHGRIEGAIHTLFRPEFGATFSGTLLALSVVGFAAAVVLRRRNQRLSAIAAVVAALCVVVRVTTQPTTVVPGLFVAAPVVWAGVWAVLTAYEDRTARFDGRVLAIVSVFAAAVVATQYSIGGGLEWGGRFFALALPAFVPIAVAALAVQPRIVLQCLTAAALALSLMGLKVMHDGHATADTLLATVRVPDDAVAITTTNALPRFDWQRYDERQWLLVSPHAAADLVERFRENDVKHVFVLFESGSRPVNVPGRSMPVPGTHWRTIDIELD